MMFWSSQKRRAQPLFNIHTDAEVYTNAKAARDIRELERAVTEIFDCLYPRQENRKAHDFLLEAGRALDAAVKELPTEPKTPSFGGNVVPFRKPDRPGPL
jgi:hypothetical protein